MSRWRSASRSPSRSRTSCPRATGSRSTACSETSEHSERCEQLLHALDLDRLIGVHVQDELLDLGLGAAALVHQLLHHRERALVVLSHVAQEEPVERLALRALELLELARVDHPGHRAVAVRVIVWV